MNVSNARYDSFLAGGYPMQAVVLSLMLSPPTVCRILQLL